MEKQTKEVALQSNAQAEVEKFNFFNPAQFEVMQRISRMFALSELVPDMYRATDKNPIEKAMANCMIAIEMAQRIGASPLMIMQNMVIIYGKPSWSSKFLISTVNTCGRFNPLQYKIISLGFVGKIQYVDYIWDAGKKKAVTKDFDGSKVENLLCVAYTKAKGSDEILESAPIDIKLAIQEGWYTKAGSKWQTMPHQMLMYRAASFWTNAYAPELSMGMKTEYEVYDIEDIEYEDISSKANRQPISMTTADDAPEYQTEQPEPVKEAQPEPEPQPQKNKVIQPSMEF